MPGENASAGNRKKRHSTPLERTAAAVYFTCGRASRVRRRGRSTAVRYLAMVILAEISDKMPSTAGIVVAWLVAAGISVGLAAAHRAIAWAVLLLALAVGGFFALGGYHESFVEGPFSEAIWHELGWPWVAASIVGPLLPVIAVAVVLIVRRPRLGR